MPNGNVYEEKTVPQWEQLNVPSSNIMLITTFVLLIRSLQSRRATTEIVSTRNRIVRLFSLIKMLVHWFDFILIFMLLYSNNKPLSLSFDFSAIQLVSKCYRISHPAFVYTRTNLWCKLHRIWDYGIHSRIHWKKHRNSTSKGKLPIRIFCRVKSWSVITLLIRMLPLIFYSNRLRIKNLSSWDAKSGERSAALKILPNMGG